MKIIIDIPEWAEDRTLTLLAGNELVAKWNDAEGWKVKAERCNQCGECCCDIPEGYLPFGITGDGRCKMLQPDGTCGAGHMKPFACLGDPEPTDWDRLGCSIRYK